MRFIFPVLAMIGISGCDDARQSPPPIPNELHTKFESRAGTWQLIDKKKGPGGDVIEVLLFNTADGEVCKITTVSDKDRPSDTSPVRCYSVNDHETDRTPPAEDDDMNNDKDQ
ncbi:hypothetical protein [Klebsiella oxytoca]|uniref:hypothetical protein n=1 Tax=Klebsiella oxytoca TaxID=571 RepID=UPI00157AC75D|nr:hypothetical protein [Klebsiella oxytoca]